jgi:hypothetical protein
MLVVAILALSCGAFIMQANAYTTISNVNGNGVITSLVSPGTLTVWGSSTVGPIATEELTPSEGNFFGYWNGLVSSGSVTSSALTSSPGVSLSTLGSGTAVPALAGLSGDGPADIGEMSRPPSDAEFGDLANMQQYAIGIDSVAIVLSPDMTWFSSVLAANSVTGLTTLQVAELFADNANATAAAGQPYAGQTMTSDQASQGNLGQTESTPLYTTWADFFAGQGWTVPSADASQASGTIIRAVRDATSGTYDCFNNYFAVPNGYQFEYKISGTASDAQELAPYTECQENLNVYNTVHGGTNTIGFISLGYLSSYGGMIGVNIAYNTHGSPKSYIAYSGAANTQGQATYTWSTPVAPTQPNVEWAYTNSKTAPLGATGEYQAWRWLWEVVPGLIPSSGPALVDGVWIAYMMADNTTTNEVAVGVGNGASSFVQDQNYIPLNRDDMTGNGVVDSNLLSFTPGVNQTQSYPSGVVNFNDITYFVTAYIAYYSQHIYNPYADLDANGQINFNDITAFVSTYIAYYATTFG